MQNLISGLIVCAALIYVANRWLPTKIKHRLMRRSKNTTALQAPAGSCSSCSSCGNCGSNTNKMVQK